MRTRRTTDRTGGSGGDRLEPRRSPTIGQGPPRRRLSDAERRAIRERRAGRPNLPPLADEGMSRGGDSTGPGLSERIGSGSRLLALGALLLVGMGVLVAGASGMFSFATGGTPPSPTAVPTATVTATPTVTVPVIATPPPSPAPDPLNDGRTIVCLDPGHGGTDSGTVYSFDDGTRPALREADLVLASAWDLAYRLRERGIEVVMTRKGSGAANAEGGDINGDGQTGADSAAAADLDDLQARINRCNEAGADLLVSLHLNGASNVNASGYETWYTGSRPFGDRSARFATIVMDELGRQMERAGYLATRREANNDDGIDAQRSGKFHNMVLTGPAIPGEISPSIMPGVIVEALFISNEQDVGFLLAPQSHDAIVTAYELAILTYFKEFPG